ncbi:polypeptide N-acetylgalactosaminyltransferase 13-like protein [Dinothrombium tinctorium]|uniref:Polypeptide N-acetylgalactosaminyltransferase n=1 Tax=Dinothrombium tinctorium TaxID=1965070 RepID=A0A3S3NXY9_9ACAR|nr:polypeptide N-acetylgalactosaminyltransferase 13-like protein [Dinothrombium tinctorium]
MKLYTFRLGSGLFRRLTGRRRICFSFSIMFITLTVICSIYLLLSTNNENIVDDNVMIVLSDTKYQKEYIDKKGIHVIVGQYVGKSLPWEFSSNLTDDILNTNNYAPVPRAGENGSPVYIEQSSYQTMRLLYGINRFNLMASDRISVNRSLPDPRKLSCKNKIYEIEKDMDTSVIIVFHNEAWSTLLRTVHSVINRSPKRLLKEIILVDDSSSRTFLGEPLDQYMSRLSRSSALAIKIIRSRLRIGLIKSRLLGADAARGKVLTFLDAHCEATIGWLEPLLARIAQSRSHVVCPVIDIIHDETFAFARSFDLHWGGMNWNLHFRWFPIGADEIEKKQAYEEDISSPFRTPIMAGGLFAIDREFFYEMGAYDENMDIWGGENIELSLRIWQCGGRIEIVPCSHVAHLFRKSSPYTFPREGGVAGVLYTNLARVAEVWMDEWKYFFYRINPVAKRTIFGNDEVVSEPEKLVNISERIELRKALQCKNFEWFLNTVWPEHFFPTKDRFFGQIRNIFLGECLQKPNSDGGPSSGSSGVAELARCGLELYAPQCFVYTKRGVLMTDDSLCLDVSNAYSGPTVLLLACSQHKRQQWKYNAFENSFKHLESNLCLDVYPNTRTLTLKQCDQSKTQRWQMRSQEWY